MDISSIEKVNELTKNLVNSGMAKDSSSAVQMAKEFVSKESTEQGPDLIVHVERLERKMLMEINKVVNKVVSLLTNLDSKIIQLDKKIDYAIEKINKPIANIDPVISKGSEETSKERTDMPADKQNKKTEPQSRFGNFTPDDINIDDYFYFGHKKK